MRASTHFRRPDKPYFGTAFALATLVILVLIFVGTLFLVPVLMSGPGQICTSGFDGPVTDASGNIVDQGHAIPETCTGSSFDWTPVLVTGVFALVIGGGIWLNVAQIRSYAHRWSSPLYYPVIWTAVTGVFVALLLSVVRRPWIELRETSCDSLGCLSSSDFSLVGSLILWAVMAVVLIPFLLSLRNLISVWRSPARFVSRRRRN